LLVLYEVEISGFIYKQKGDEKLGDSFR